MSDRIEAVRFIAACDDGCGGDAEWNGTVAATGGGTSYMVRCLTQETAATMREDTPTSGNPLAVGDVVDSSPRGGNAALDYMQRLLGRRSA